MYVYVCNKSKRHEKLPSESSVCLKQSGGGAVAQSKPKHHTWFGLGHPKHHHSHAGTDIDYDDSGRNTSRLDISMHRVMVKMVALVLSTVATQRN